MGKINMTRNRHGQATLEFTFAMVVVALLVFALIKIFQWAGMDYAQKSYIQQNSKIFDDWTANMQSETRTPRMVAHTSAF